MNGRRIVWLALFTMGVAAVLAAMSTVADPVDINNPPTEDWFFDSGDQVVIAHRTWNINYNITVANDTFLGFTECTFTFSDPADLYSRWINVWWNGSIVINNCTFKSTGNAKYYIILQNDTKIMGSSFSGMKAPATYMGGISAFDIDIKFTSTTIKDVEGVAVWTENCNILGETLSVSNSGGDYTDGASFMAVYWYNSWEDMYDLEFTDCSFSNNPYRGFGLRAYSNWADITAVFTNCNIDNNGQRGLDIYWGRDGSYESTNASLDMTLTKCSFDGNTWDGFRYQQYDVRRDGDSSVAITLDDCDFYNGQGSGAFINVYRGDQYFDFVVNDCEFVGNAIGGRAGLAFSNQYMYSIWNVTVTNCIFTDNDFYGLHIDHRSTMLDGGSFIIEDCTFKDQTENLYIYNYRSYEYYNEFWITDCTFSGSKNAGIFQYIGYSMIPLEVHVEGCDFSDSTGAGIASRGANDQSDGVLWEIEGCTFKDLGGKAIKFNLDYVMSGATLDISNCLFDKTGGIEFRVTRSISTAHAEHVLSVTNIDVTNSSASAIEAVIFGYYGVKLTVGIDTVSIVDAMFNGIRVQTSYNYAAATETIDMDVDIKDLTIDTVQGNGIDIGTDKVDYAGTRTIDVNGLDISTVSKAMLLSGLKGDLHGTVITASLNEDFTAINSDIEVYQATIDALDEGTVAVIESGSVKFWYSLKIFVNWDTGNAVEGAVVEITDNQHTLIGVRTQPDDTGLPELMLNSFQFRETGMFTRSPYVLNVTFRAIQKVVAVNLDGDIIRTIELADHVPPKIIINEPMPGHIQKETVINVRGSAYDTESDVAMVEVSIDGVTWIETTTTTAWEHTFTVTQQDIIDNGGVFTIRARATDLAGNEASTVTSMEIDPFPPELRVDHPYDGFQTNIQTLTVRGVTEVGATVMVNGVEIVVVGTLFVAQVDLVEGPNTITVQAFDALGNAKQEKMEVVLDTKPPYLVLLTPTEGEMFTEPTCTVSGQAEEGLVIIINGNTLGDAHYNNGTFEFAVSLTRGVNMITVMATDMAGNVLTIHRTVVLDDVPPVLAVQSPLDGSHQNDMTIVVIGTTDVDAFLLINGELVDLDHGLFTYSFVGVEGPNTILISASDVAGNVVGTTLSVTIDTVGPSMTVSSPPTDDEMVTDDAYVIAGQTEGATKVWLNSVPGDIETDGSFAIPVTLLEGENRFIISIEDQAGNSVTENRYVTLDTVPPVLVVRIPDIIDKDGDLTFKTAKGELSMTITGFTDDALQIRYNGNLVPVSTEGYFVIDYLLNVNAANTIVITAVDAAGNEAVWEETVTHKHLPDEVSDTFDWGLLILVVGLILLAIVIFVGWKRLSTVEEQQEMVVEEDQVLAPAAMPEVEEEEEEIDDEEDEDLLVDDEEEEEVHELTPPSERPKTDTSRPAADTPDEEVTIEIDEKDLEEKDAEGDVDADESEQKEGI